MRSRPTHLRAISLAVGGLAVLALSGCAAASTPTTSDAVRFTTGGHHSCHSRASIELDGDSHTFIVSGHCASVTVNGDGDIVRLAHTDTLAVNGQSATITVAGNVRSAVLRGNGVQLSADSIGSMEITGQRNSVSAPALGSVVVQGDHNVVRSSQRPSNYQVSGQDDILTLR
jgi:hypothetical protein